MTIRTHCPSNGALRTGEHWRIASLLGTPRGSECLLPSKALPVVGRRRKRLGKDSNKADYRAPRPASSTQRRPADSDYSPPEQHRPKMEEVRSQPSHDLPPFTPSRRKQCAGVVALLGWGGHWRTVSRQVCDFDRRTYVLAAPHVCIYFLIPYNQSVIGQCGQVSHDKCNNDPAAHRPSYTCHVLYQHSMFRL